MLTPDMSSSSGHFDVVQKGNLAIILQFLAPPTDTVSLVCCGGFENIIRINSESKRHLRLFWLSEHFANFDCFEIWPCCKQERSDPVVSKKYVWLRNSDTIKFNLSNFFPWNKNSMRFRTMLYCSVRIVFGTFSTIMDSAKLCPSSLFTVSFFCHRLHPLPVP